MSRSSLFTSVRRRYSTMTSPKYTPTTIKSAATSFLDFVNASPTPFHAVKSIKERLVAAGFKEISEKQSWSSHLSPSGKYFLTRNASTVIAFAIGRQWHPGNPICMIGAHTDSPCLRLKPVSKKTADGYLQVGVETYGGGLWHTWFDRDLGLAGRVMVKSGDGVVQKLVHIDRPILRIPTLAVHLDRQEKFEFNKETQLVPIVGLVKAELRRVDGQRRDGEEVDEEKEKEKEKERFSPLQAITTRHHSHIVQVIAEHAGVEPNDVLDFELVLYDTQKACLGGLNDEFIFSARLDNLNQTYCATLGLIDSVSHPDALKDESSIRLIACFDHEEIGSMSAQGAFSSMLPQIIKRLSVLPGGNFVDDADHSDKSYDKTNDNAEHDLSTAYEQTLASSFLLSTDMAHAVHPNYPAKYEADHRPAMNAGPVIKINANQRYATNSPGIVLLQEVARRAPKILESDHEGGVPLQLFVVRNDSSCGSTIGPMLAASLGARTLDMGNAQLSMHSCRETGGSEDVHHAVRLFSSFFREYSELERRVLID